MNNLTECHILLPLKLIKLTVLPTGDRFNLTLNYILLKRIGVFTNADNQAIQTFI